MKFLNPRQKSVLHLSVLAAFGFSTFCPVFAMTDDEIRRGKNQTAFTQYDLLREFERKLKDFSPAHQSMIQTLIQLHGFDIVPHLLDHALSMKRYDERDQNKEIASQFAFLAAYKKNASDEQWEALKLLIQTHGFDPVQQALRSREDEQKEPSIKTQRKHIK
jgi:hypothetical protein